MTSNEIKRKNKLEPLTTPGSQASTTSIYLSWKCLCVSETCKEKESFMRLRNCILYVLPILDKNKASGPLPLYLIFILHPQAKTIQGVRRKACAESHQKCTSWEYLHKLSSAPLMKVACPCSCTQTKAKQIHSPIWTLLLHLMKNENRLKTWKKPMASRAQLANQLKATSERIGNFRHKKN